MFLFNVYYLWICLIVSYNFVGMAHLAPPPYVPPELLDHVVDCQHRSFLTTERGVDVGCLIRSRVAMTTMPIDQHWISRYMLHFYKFTTFFINRVFFRSKCKFQLDALQVTRSRPFCLSHVWLRRTWCGPPFGLRTGAHGSSSTTRSCLPSSTGGARRRTPST